MAKGKKTGGRVVGTPNKNTSDIREWSHNLAEQTQARALELLASDDEGIAFKMIREIWNRAYGMPSQHITGDGSLATVFAGIKIVIQDKGEKVTIVNEPTKEDDK